MSGLLAEGDCSRIAGGVGLGKPMAGGGGVEFALKVIGFDKNGVDFNHKYILNTRHRTLDVRGISSQPSVIIS
jgi:hypothetical protein